MIQHQCPGVVIFKMNELKVIQFAEKEYKKPFEWGKNDCNTLVLNYLDKIYLSDTFIKIAYKKYSSLKEAIKFQKEYEVRLTNFCLGLGLKKIPANKARTGDILIIEEKNFEIGHICLGSLVLSVVIDETTDMAKIPSFNEFDHGLRL